MPTGWTTIRSGRNFSLSWRQFAARTWSEAAEFME